MPITWTTAVWQHFRAGNLSRGARDVLLTLHTYRGRGGDCWPAHATLADRARCSASTVLRALRAARELGLVAWSERRVRAGWRWLRTSNVYRFTVPDKPPEPQQNRHHRTNSQHARGGERKKIIGGVPSPPAAWQPSEVERRSAQAALAAINARRAAVVAGSLLGRRAQGEEAGRLSLATTLSHSQ